MTTAKHAANDPAHLILLKTPRHSVQPLCMQLHSYHIGHVVHLFVCFSLKCCMCVCLQTVLSKAIIYLCFSAAVSYDLLYIPS